MQPGTNPDDLQTILSRFHTWTDQQPGRTNGRTPTNGHGVEGIRELTYAEAVEQHRQRQAAPKERRRKPVRAAREAVAVPIAAASGTAKTEPPPPIVSATGETLEAEPQRFVPPPVRDAATLGTQTLPFAEEELPLVADKRAPSETRLHTAAAKPAPDAPKKIGPRTTKILAADRRAEANVPAAAKREKLSVKAATARTPTKTGAKVAAGIKPVAAKAVPKVASRAVSASPVKSIAAASRPARKSAAKAAARRRKHPEFRQVLAKSLSAATKRPTSNQAAKKKAAPERTRRITTRFSSAEERRLEKAAGQAGMTVSAYLRKCALATEQARTIAQAPPAAKRHVRAATARPAVETQLFAQPATTSLVGGWLTLLRQRFLSSPARFAERA